MTIKVFLFYTLYNKAGDRLQMAGIRLQGLGMSLQL